MHTATRTYRSPIPFKPAAFTPAGDRNQHADAILAPLEHLDIMTGHVPPVQFLAAAARLEGLPGDQRTATTLQEIIADMRDPEIQIQIEAEYLYRFPDAGAQRDRRQNAITRDAKLAAAG